MRFFKKQIESKIIILLALAIIQACSPTKNTAKKKNFSYIYNPSITSLHPEYLVFHKSETRSMLMVKFYPNELLFNQVNADDKYTAEIKFSYFLYNEKTKEMEDSSSALIDLDLNEVEEEMVSFIPFNAQFGNKYNLQVITRDVKRKTQHRSAIFVDKTNKFSKQNFVIRQFGNSAPVFNNWVDSSTVFFIDYAYGKYDSLNISYFKDNFNVPSPPSTNVFKIDKFNKPDSQYTVFVSDTNLFRLTRKGFYTFQIDTAKDNGISLAYFGEDFPYLTLADDLLQPLNYLTNKPTFRSISGIPNRKLAVDNFWLDVANDNIELAREVLRIYYNRVYLANYFFTSYKEGWKTDRGMIYIMYGLPNYIYKSDKTERWVYEEMQGPEQLYFKFKKIMHPYSNQHYMLIRSELLQTRWKDAVESWNSGKPYSFN